MVFRFIALEAVSDDKNNILKEKHKKWLKLINMPSETLEKFLGTETGQKAGLSREEAKKLGIDTGHQSAQAILRMRKKPFSEWTAKDISWMNRQISFVSRMTGNKGPLVKKVHDKEVPTRKLTSLWLWGNIPEGYPPSRFNIFK